jgi:hypothetical protein
MKTRKQSVRAVAQFTFGFAESLWGSRDHAVGLNRYQKGSYAGWLKWATPLCSRGLAVHAEDWGTRFEVTFATY